jgi:hypothetical protein
MRWLGKEKTIDSGPYLAARPQRNPGYAAFTAVSRNAASL